ncbi:MAG: lipid-A-disaccharide synthase, partial [Chitinispirillaceae bacterium]
TSGTATLETALLGVPQIIAYHTSLLTYTVVRQLLRIPYIGLPNIIAGEAIVPECIQKQSEGPRLAAALERFFESPELYNATVSSLIALREKLGEKKPSLEMSSIIKGIAEQSRP